MLTAPITDEFKAAFQRILEDIEVEADLTAPVTLRELFQYTEKDAICGMCRQIVNRRSGNTTSMRDHLRARHVKLFERLEQSRVIFPTTRGGVSANNSAKRKRRKTVSPPVEEEQKPLIIKSEIELAAAALEASISPIRRSRSGRALSGRSVWSPIRDGKVLKNRSSGTIGDALSNATPIANYPTDEWIPILTAQKRRGNGVSSSTSHTAQRSPSRASGSSSTNNEPNQNTATNGAEIPAMTAYRIRQTYIFMRVLSSQRPVFCKANDEDFFPPHRTNSSAADRANWSAGQIITAYFDFDQKKTECVVEAVGDRETVQLRLQEALVTDALKRPNGIRGGTQTPQMNGSSRRVPSPNSALRELLIPKLENGVDEEERMSMDGGSADSALLDDADEPVPSKRPRLDSANGFLSSDAISARFEQLERRIRALESRRPAQSSATPLVPAPTMNGHNGVGPLNAQFDVEVDGERISLKEVPTETLAQQIETNKMALMEKPLVLNGRRLYDDFHHINLARVLQHGTSKEFGARVLALLLSEEARRRCYMPPISSAIAANGSANTATGRELKKVVVDAFKKLLIFAGGSAICPADQPAWFAAIYAALPQNSANPDGTPERFADFGDDEDSTPHSPTMEPVFGAENAFVETSRAASTISSS